MPRKRRLPSPPPKPGPETSDRELLIQRVVALRLRCLPMRLIERVVRDEFEGRYGETATRSALHEGLARLHDAHQSEKRYWQSEQLSRLLDLLSRLLASPEKLTTGKLNVLVKVEQLLAQIMGTLAPTELRVDSFVTECNALAGVIANITPERHRALLDQARLRKAKAARLDELEPGFLLPRSTPQRRAPLLGPASPPGPAGQAAPLP
jgi:hypothetical protein